MQVSGHIGRPGFSVGIHHCTCSHVKLTVLPIHSIAVQFSAPLAPPLRSAPKHLSACCYSLRWSGCDLSKTHLPSPRAALGLPWTAVPLRRSLQRRRPRSGLRPSWLRWWLPARLPGPQSTLMPSARCRGHGVPTTRRRRHYREASCRQYCLEARQTWRALGASNLAGLGEQLVSMGRRRRGRGSTWGHQVVYVEIMRCPRPPHPRATATTAHNSGCHSRSHPLAR